MISLLRDKTMWAVALAVIVMIMCFAGGLSLSADDGSGDGGGQLGPSAPASGPPVVTRSTGAPSPSSGDGVGGIVPAVTGLRLTEAEALLRSAGFAAVTLVDATGQERVVVDRNNWVVEAQDPAAGTPLTGGLGITLRVRKPTDGQGSGTITKGVVPNVLCKDLQGAQDALRAAGFYNLQSKDGTGQGRFQAVDRNWVVIAQSAAPDDSPDLLTHIVLTVVKFGEPTGDSGCAS